MKTDAEKAVRQLDTDELLKLVEQSSDLSATMSEHSEDFTTSSFSEQLKALLTEARMSPAVLEQRSLLSRTFTYQLLRGERTPGRDIVLRVAVAIHCDIDQTQRLLRLAQRGALYPRVKRDAVLLHALKHHLDLADTNDLLLSMGQTPLV